MTDPHCFHAWGALTESTLDIDTNIIIITIGLQFLYRILDFIITVIMYLYYLILLLLHLRSVIIDDECCPWTILDGLKNGSTII